MVVFCAPGERLPGRGKGGEKMALWLFHLLASIGVWTPVILLCGYGLARLAWR